MNVFLPLTLGKLVEVLEKGDGTSFWPYVLVYVGLRFLQSNGGIAALRDVSSRISNAASSISPKFSQDPLGARDAIFR